MGKETFRTRCLLKLNVISGIVKVLPPGTSASSIEFGWVVSPCLPLAWGIGTVSEKERDIEPKSIEINLLRAKPFLF